MTPSSEATALATYYQDVLSIANLDTQSFDPSANSTPGKQIFQTPIGHTPGILHPPGPPLSPPPASSPSVESVRVQTPPPGPSSAAADPEQPEQPQIEAEKSPTSVASETLVESNLENNDNSTSQYQGQFQYDREPTPDNSEEISRLITILEGYQELNPDVGRSLRLCKLNERMALISMRHLPTAVIKQRIADLEAKHPGGNLNSTLEVNDQIMINAGLIIIRERNEKQLQEHESSFLIRVGASNAEELIIKYAELEAEEISDESLSRRIICLESIIRKFTIAIY